MPCSSPIRLPGHVARIFRPLVLSFLLIIGLEALCSGQQSSQNVVDVYLNQGRKVSFDHAVRVLVMNDDICSAKISSADVEFFGLKRGQSVVFVWTTDTARTAYLVRVVAPPEVAIGPRLETARDAALGHGYSSSSVQSLTGTGVTPVTAMVQKLDWEQGDNNGRLTIRAEGDGSTQSSMHNFNISTATIQYRNSRAIVSLIDSVLSVNGGAAAQVTPYSTTGGLTLRGADVILPRGANTFEAFAGTTVPAYFLNNSGARDIAGINFSRKFSKRLTLFTTTAFTSIPVMQFSPQSVRRQDGVQTMGLTYRLNTHWAWEADGGLSTSGGHAQGAMSYAQTGRSIYFSASSSAANFPLNQLQFFPTGTFLGSTGFTQSLGSRVITSASYQHTTSQPDIFSNTKTTSDYVNPSLSILLTRRERLSLGYTFSHADSTQISARSNNQRLEAALSSQFSYWLNNTAQVSTGSLASPQQFNTQSQLHLADSLDFRIKGRTFTLNASHDRVDLSLVNRLNQEIQLLPPALRNLFLFDPAGFIASGNLSPDLRAILQGMQPSNTQVSLSAQLLIGRKINFSPTVGYFHQDQQTAVKSSSQTFGYTMNWQLAQSLSLQSSLSNAFLWDSSVNALRRTTIFSIGLTKAFSGVPALGFHHRTDAPTIQGIVFRDSNVSGAYRNADVGIPNVLVHLDDGRSTVTDENGKFEFTGLQRHRYMVTMELAQFKSPMRLTTPASMTVSPGNGGEVAFGIVDFSRITGTVFNDYLFTSEILPDAAGIKEVQLTLKGHGQTWKTTTDSAGEFEIDNVPAGNYEVSVDRGTLPPNYVILTASYPVQVVPAATVVQNFPVRALRSIAGRVVFRPKTNPAENSKEKSKSMPEPQEASPVPLKNVKLAIGDRTVITDAEGSFIFRELPGGPLLLTIIPENPPPDSVKLPSWPVTLPHEPFKVESVSITISNPDLLAYILAKDAVVPGVKKHAALAHPEIHAALPIRMEPLRAPIVRKVEPLPAMAQVVPLPEVPPVGLPDSFVAPTSFICIFPAGQNPGSTLLLCSDKPQPK